MLECDGNWLGLQTGNSFAALLDQYHGASIDQSFANSDTNSFMRTFPDSQSFMHDAFYMEVDQKNNNNHTMHLTASSDNCKNEDVIIGSSNVNLDDAINKIGSKVCIEIKRSQDILVSLIFEVKLFNSTQ